MKSNYSASWKGSKQPRKQRKYRYNLPTHLAGDLLSVHLSEDLRKNYSTRALRVRVGDKVRVLRGTHKGKEGKVERVDAKNHKVFVSKIESVKKEGGKSLYPLSPSNLLLIDLQQDKMRFKRLLSVKDKKNDKDSENSAAKTVKEDATSNKNDVKNDVVSEDE